MNFISCYIGSTEQIQLQVNDKFEVDSLFKDNRGLDVEFGDFVTEVTVNYFPTISFGIMGFRLEESGDPSVGYMGGDMGYSYIAFHTTFEISKMLKILIERANRQKMPFDKYNFKLFSKKAVSLNGLTCESYLIGAEVESTFEPDDY
jgi:hypothetical protein